MTSAALARLFATVVTALLNCADVAVKNSKGEDVKLIKNPLKVVHGGQNYKYTDIPVKDGDMLTTEGYISDVCIKGDLLFLVATTKTKSCVRSPRKSHDVCHVINVTFVMPTWASRQVQSKHGLRIHCIGGDGAWLPTY